MLAMPRPNSRVVSTSSAQTIQRPGFFEVRAGMAVELDAARAEVPSSSSSSCSRCCRAGRRASTGAAARRSPAAVLRRQPCSATTVCSWQWMSRHSRTRRGDEVLAQQLLVLAAELVVMRRRAHPGVAAALRRSKRSPATAPAACGGASEPHSARRQELALLVVELRVRLVGLPAAARAAGRARPAPTARGDDQHLAQRAALARLEDHAADARVERQPRQLAADRRQLVGVVDRAQLVEQLVAVGDRAARGGGSRNGKSSTRPRRSDFMRRITPASEERRISGIGEARPRGEVGLVVQADADAVGHAAAAAGALVGRGLADRLDQQLLDLAAVAVALDAGRAGCRSRSGCRAPSARSRRRWWRARCARPCGCRTRGPARPATGARTAAAPRRARAAVRQVLAQVVGRLADLALAGQEHEDVAAAAAPQLVDRVGDRVVQSSTASRDSSNGRQRCSTGYMRPDTLDHRRRPAPTRSAARSARRRSSPRSRSPSGRAAAAAAARR